MQRFQEIIAYKKSDNSIVRKSPNTTRLKLRNCKNINTLEDKVVCILKKYKSNNESSVCAEDIAIELNYKVKFIKQIFAKLNLRGLLSQKYRYHMNGTNRAHMFYGDASGWSSNYYTILKGIEFYEKS